MTTDEKLLELTKLVIEANKKGVKINIEMFGGGNSINVWDLSGEKVKQIGSSYAFHDLEETDNLSDSPGFFKLSELASGLRDYINKISFT